MKKTKTNSKVFKKAIKSFVEESLLIDARGTTCIVFYQPKVPKGIEKFKKSIK